MTTWRLVACDWTTPLAEIDQYESLTLIARYNDVSTFELALEATTDAAQILLNASRPRLQIQADGATYRSGPLVHVERELAADGGDMLTLSGVDDLVWLRRRLAHPQPGTAAPPYNTTAYDAQTGAASTVIAGYVNRNAGPAAVAARQVPGLTVPTPSAFGGTVTCSARYQNLLEFLQPIANAAKVGFRVTDLAFQVYQPTGTALFSVELGTLAGWRSAADAPDTNYVYVAGGGTDISRLIREYQDPAAVMAYGRIESFRDRRDTTTPAEMDQSGAEALADGIPPPVVEMQALDTDGQRFLRDWNVGDLATVTIGGDTRTDVIAEARLELRGNEPAMVAPSLGGPPIDLASFRRIVQQDRRVRQLERV